MNETIPPLPAGFVLEDEQAPAPAATSADPPLPPGFVLEDAEPSGIGVDVTGGTVATADDLTRDAQIVEQFRNRAGPPDAATATGPEPKASLFRADSDFQDQAGLGAGNMIWAAAKDMFGSDEGVAEYLAKKAGGRVERDKDGAPLVVLPSGDRYRMNDSGLDSTDVASVAGNVGAFLTPAGWAAKLGQAKNLGLGARALTQAGAAGATDVALQLGFDGGRVDPVRTAATAAGGALGEGAGTALAVGGRRVMDAVRSATGANKAAARNMLAEAGMLRTSESVGRVAAAQNELAAGADPRALLGREEFGLQYTQGQRVLDPVRKFEMLSREELLRQSPGGGAALREAERQNVDQVGNALAGIGTRLGSKAGASPAELAQGAAGRLREQADELGGRISQAYDEAGRGNRAAISGEAVRGLPARLTAAVSDFAPSPELMPAASKTLQQIKLATDTILKGGDGANVRGVTLKALETQRRILNNNYNAATNNADRAAMSAIKREFDGWLDEAVDGALVSGDPQALAAIKMARGLRAEFGKRFEGKAETDKFIGGLLDGTRTPEELVNIALGAGQVSKAAGARFVDRLKTAAGNDPEVIGQLRAAHFLRLTQNVKGEALKFGELVRNIRQTDYTNASVVKALYSPQEWAEVKRLADALEPLIEEGTFARRPGTADQLLRMIYQRVGGGLPLVGEVLKGVGSVRDTIRANAALNKPLRLPASAHPAYPAVLAPVGGEAFD